MSLEFWTLLTHLLSWLMVVFLGGFLWFEVGCVEKSALLPSASRMGRQCAGRPEGCQGQKCRSNCAMELLHRNWWLMGFKSLRRKLQAWKSPDSQKGFVNERLFTFTPLHLCISAAPGAVPAVG